MGWGTRIRLLNPPFRSKRLESLYADRMSVTTTLDHTLMGSQDSWQESFPGWPEEWLRSSEPALKKSSNASLQKSKSLRHRANATRRANFNGLPFRRGAAPTRFPQDFQWSGLLSEADQAALGWPQNQWSGEPANSIRKGSAESDLRDRGGRSAKTAEADASCSSRDFYEECVEWGSYITDDTGDENDIRPRIVNKELRREYEKLLASVFNTSCLNYIYKKPGMEWLSGWHPLSFSQIAFRAASDDEEVIGVRHERQVRLIVVDIDNKPGKPSKYWHPLGKSKELLRLQEVAEDCGCKVDFVVSSNSGGLHVYIALPEWTHAFRAHWIGRALLQRAGIATGAGQAELFPSEMPFHAGSPSERPLSNGFRLPGQEGSALVVGDRTITHPVLILQQLQSAVEEAQSCLNFKKLVSQADSLRKQSKRCSKVSNGISEFKRSSGNVEWTGPSQSNKNIGLLTTQARLRYKPETPDRLAAIVEQLAIESPGFNEYASDHTKKILTGWCKSWANCSFRRGWNANGKTVKVETSADSDRNERLFNASRERLRNLFSKMKNTAVDLSKNQIRQLLGMGWATIQKHWEYWLQLLQGEVHHTPLYKGCEHRNPGTPQEEEQAAAEPARFFEQKLQESRDIFEKAFKTSPDRRYLTHEELINMSTQWMMDDDLPDFLQDDRDAVQQQC